MLTSSIGCKVSDLLEERSKSLAVLIDPDKFDEGNVASFLNNLPANATFIFVGGSTVEQHVTSLVAQRIKAYTNLPVVLFPGDYSQITEEADALLFLSLISGRNPEYLIEQQIKSVAQLRNSSLEIIPTGYILIDGGTESAVQRVSKTTPISQEDVELIVNTALAGQYSGKKLIYLEAGSGAKTPISDEIIREVKNAITIPLIVGGGIRSSIQLEKAYSAGADIVVVGTAFEQNNFKY
jgi:phosphoglycerol geranylgeranyltransferase